jgi:hypothetical protein
MFSVAGALPGITGGIADVQGSLGNTLGTGAQGLGGIPNG